MTPSDFMASIIRPGLDQLHELGGPPPTMEAARFLLAIALTESGPTLSARYQASPGPAGPARGWWQFEQGGGVKGVLNHRATAKLAGVACTACVVVASDAAVWRAIEGHDVLACMFARMLVMTTPKALPIDADAGYLQYLDLWRPGRPCSSATWGVNWTIADETL